MQWVIVTCNATRHIVPAQLYLFNKYANGARLQYINLGKNDINKWGPDVARQLPYADHVIFGLDDYLPIDYLNWKGAHEAYEIVRNSDLDRFEFGWGAVHGHNSGRHIEDIVIDTPIWRFPPDGLYTVSCQFSIWKTSTLRHILQSSTTPWNFEKSNWCKAACFSTPIFRWIEESALSGRHPAKVNVLGLRPADLEELISLGMIDRSRIQFGMPKGPVPPFDPKALGPKYRQFYE